jgi:hypothetical protein
LDALAARFAVLPVPVAAIPCKAQALFVVGILDGAHASSILPSAEYATVY